MAQHHIYHTEGFVLSGRDTGEANKMLSLFTRELGLIRAHAQSLRTLRSKLRYSLQEYSFARIDLVQGREIWRITSAGKIEVLDRAVNDPRKILVVARVSRLLERLYHGEEANFELFDFLRATLTFLENEEFSPSLLKAFEAYTVGKVLNFLGYWKEEENDPVRLPLSMETLLEVEKGERALVMRINSALRETHL